MSNTIDLVLPKHYGEMDEKQTKFVASLILKGETEHTLFTKCFIRFAGIKPIYADTTSYFFRQQKTKSIFSLEFQELNYFAKKLSFLTSHYIGIHPLKKKGPFIPCDRLLRNINFIQYLEAENFYQAFIHTKNEKFLFSLIATLYGKKNEMYDNQLTERRARYFNHKASEIEKLITLMWFIGIKEYFTKKFPYLFEGSNPSRTTPPDMYNIMQSQIRILTDGDISKQKSVLTSKTWDALGELNEKSKEVKELKKKYPKMFK